MLLMMMSTDGLPRRAPLGMPAPLSSKLRVSEVFCPWRWLARMADDLDDRRARRARVDFGRRGWLLSWEPDPEGGWRARLSGAETVRTIVRTGSTRRAAIRRARRAMDRLIAFQSGRDRAPA